jgi:hypothetical protein
VAIRNIHEKFARETTFLNVGLVVASLILLVRSVSDPGYAPEAAIIDPRAAFGSSAALCLLGLVLSKSERRAFNFYRDGLPPLAFAACLILAGFRHNVTWVLLAAAIVTNILFLLSAGKHDIYDEDRDRIPVYFRWPF